MTSSALAVPHHRPVLTLLRAAGALFVLVTAFGQTPANLVLDTFDAGTARGRVVPGSSWESGVSRLPSSITLGGEARDDNGWQAEGLTLDASGFTAIAVTGRRLAGNAAASLVVEFQDAQLNTAVFSTPLATFAEGTLDTVRIPIVAWAPGFDYTRIIGWTIGGGTPPPGSTALRLELAHLELSATGGPAVQTLPAITTQPVGRTAALNAPVTLTVVAQGSPAPAYQWRKDGLPVTGATQASFTLTLTTATAGRYTVAVTNAVGSVLSAPAVVALEGATGTAAPVVAGGGATGGSGGGAVGATTPAAGGSGLTTVTFTPPAGSTNTSATAANPAAATTPATPAGSAAVASVYFGTLPGGGAWSLVVRADRTGTFLAHLPEQRAGAIADFRLAGDNSLSAQGTTLQPRGVLSAAGDRPATASSGAVFTLSARLESDRVTGVFQGQTFTGLPDRGAFAEAGLYRARALLTEEGEALVAIGAGGRVLALTAMPEQVDATAGQLANGTAFQGTSALQGRVALSLTPGTRGLHLALTPAGAPAAIRFLGLPEALPATSALANLSIRTVAGTADQTLIAGFALAGGTRPVLLRGVGPALREFGVEGTLPNPRLELRQAGRGEALTANDDWGTEAGDVFPRVGAFALPRGSRDAAVYSPLPASTYTARVSDASDASGIALLEIYDAGSAGAGRLTNVSARSQVGTGSDVLIAGFNLAGQGPRRLLIRAVGPALRGFGVEGTLADPRLDLFAAGESAPLATNNDWPAALAPVFAQVGAFPLPSGSWDAALLVTLPPGSYTAQVSGVDGATGVALVEIYEVD